MNKVLAATALFVVCTLTVQAQSNLGSNSNSNTSDAATTRPSSQERRDSRRASLPNARQSVSSNSSSRKPTTVNQVEQQTGGKVIGARPVNVQGRQLNQIKVQMPNGRIVIHRQLFDENGRSVDTVQQVDDEPRTRNEATDD